MESLLEIFVESPSSSLAELLLNSFAEPCFGSFDKLPLGNFFQIHQLEFLSCHGMLLSHHPWGFTEPPFSILLSCLM